MARDTGTGKKTRRSSLCKRMAFTVPKGWGELKQEQLRKMLELLCMFSDRPDGILYAKMGALLWFCDLEAVRHTPGGWLCRENKTKKTFVLADGLLPSLMEALEWLEHPEDMSIRLEEIDGCKAADQWLRTLPFIRYIQAENYYQAYLQTHEEKKLQMMAQQLYDIPEGKTFSAEPAELLGVLFWFMAIKKYYASVFTHFLKPVSDGQDAGTRQSQLEMTNAMIRLLSKGDVTKVKDIYNVDTWLALTELDALAKESEEFKNKYGKRNV